MALHKDSQSQVHFLLELVLPVDGSSARLASRGADYALGTCNGAIAVLSVVADLPTQYLSVHCPQDRAVAESSPFLQSRQFCGWIPKLAHPSTVDLPNRWNHRPAL